MYKGGFLKFQKKSVSLDKDGNVGKPNVLKLLWSTPASGPYLSVIPLIDRRLMLSSQSELITERTLAWALKKEEFYSWSIDVRSAQQTHPWSLRKRGMFSWSMLWLSHDIRQYRNRPYLPLYTFFFPLILSGSSECGSRISVFKSQSVDELIWSTTGCCSIEASFVFDACVFLFSSSSHRIRIRTL